MKPADERAAAKADAPRFAANFRVRHYEADAVGHVNNAAYLHYLEQAAIEHSAAVGYPLGRYREMSMLFIVRRHEVEYLRLASPGDVLEVVTWAAEILGPRTVCAYEVYRHGQAASEVGTITVPADGLLPGHSRSCQRAAGASLDPGRRNTTTHGWKATLSGLRARRHASSTTRY